NSARLSRLSTGPAGPGFAGSWAFGGWGAGPAPATAGSRARGPRKKDARRNRGTGVGMDGGPLVRRGGRPRKESRGQSRNAPASTSPTPGGSGRAPGADAAGGTPLAARSRSPAQNDP